MWCSLNSYVLTAAIECTGFLDALNSAPVPGIKIKKKKAGTSTTPNTKVVSPTSNKVLTDLSRLVSACVNCPLSVQKIFRTFLHFDVYLVVHIFYCINKYYFIFIWILTCPLLCCFNNNLHSDVTWCCKSVNQSTHLFPHARLKPLMG